MPRAGMSSEFPSGTHPSDAGHGDCPQDRGRQIQGTELSYDYRPPAYPAMAPFLIDPFYLSISSWTRPRTLYGPCTDVASDQQKSGQSERLPVPKDSISPS